METTPLIEAMLFENRFWLQIMGDHSRFIFFSLAPTESEYIVIAQNFIHQFDQLLEQSHKQLSDSELEDISRKAYETTYQFREFKLELLSMSLVSDLKSHLSPSFLNDMLNELEEYLLILDLLINAQLPIFHPLHYHLLWLTDSISHTASVSAGLDFAEKDLVDSTLRYQMQFHDLYTKAFLMNGYLRTQIDNFPSLNKLNEQVKIPITNFMEFLENLRDQRMDGKVLGTLMPLMADHMSREECYYLIKLSQVTPTIRTPDCDPTRPRIEK